jgi:hypothetical protein
MRAAPRDRRDERRAESRIEPLIEPRIEARTEWRYEARTGSRDEPRAERDREALPTPLIWTFDGPFERCLADLDDTLRRALVMVGDAARLALLIDLSLPALQRRVEAGDRVQPAWGLFIERIARYGLPAAPRVRHLRAAGPLATLVIAYRN